MKYKFKVRQEVRKITGYQFPGIVAARYLNLDGKPRYVVIATGSAYRGCSHIFNGEQLEAAINQEREPRQKAGKKAAR